MITPTTEAPSLSLSVSGVLEILLGDGDGHLELAARTEDGIGQREIHVNSVKTGWLPPTLLELLVEGDWCVRVSPAAHTLGGLPVRLSAVYARWLIEPVRTYDGFEIPSEAAAAVSRSLKDFPLAPSALIDGALEVVALWRLERSLDLRGGLESALELQARLAATLGASTHPVRHVTTSLSAAGVYDMREYAAHDLRLPIPLAGVVREWDGRPPIVEIPACDPRRIYPLAEIEQAIEKETR